MAQASTGAAVNAASDGVGCDGWPEAVRSLLSSLPDSVSRIPDEFVEVISVDDMPNCRRQPSAEQRVWLVQDRRIARRGRVNVLIAAPERDGGRASGDVVIYTARALQKSMSVKVVGAGASLIVGSGRGLNGSIVLGGGAQVVFGDDSTAQNVDIITRNSAVLVGRDCMISGGVSILPAQHHGLVDLSGDVARLYRGKDRVVLGDHVWLGHKSLLLGGAEIGPGSIVAAGAVVARPMPANVLIAGSPATVKRENMTWSRDPDRIDGLTEKYIASLGLSGAGEDTRDEDALPQGPSDGVTQ